MADQIEQFPPLERHAFFSDQGVAPADRSDLLIQRLVNVLGRGDH
jgi:hypothetical protein